MNNNHKLIPINSIKTLPNFIIIGAEKAGTTSLYHYLKKHPQIYMSPEKEPFYYVFKKGTPKILGNNINKDIFLRTRIKNEKEYRKQFEGVSGELAIGEASASYLYVKEAAYAIKHDIPKVKIIVVLRQPAERAYSNYLHCIKRGVEPTRDFNLYVKNNLEESRINENWGLILYYIEKGFYHKYLTEYFKLFDKENIKVVLFNNLKNNPEKTLKDIFNFLEVDSSFVPDLKKVHNVSEKDGLEKNPLTDIYKSRSPAILNAKKLIPARIRKSIASILSKKYRKPIAEMTAETKATLNEMYKEDIKLLEELIQLNLSHWK